MHDQRIRHSAFGTLEKIWLEAQNWRAQMWISRVDKEEILGDIGSDQKSHNIEETEALNTQLATQSKKYGLLKRVNTKYEDKGRLLAHFYPSIMELETIPETPEISVVLVGTVRSANVPFWQCRGIKWQVKAADEHLRARFARWKRALRPSGDTETAWVLRWPCGLQALLYGYAHKGGVLKVQCSVFDSGSMYNIGVNMNHARDTDKTQIKKANKESLRRLTIAALRLRGIMPQHGEFRQLIEQTSSAARDRIGQERIPLDAQRWVVERLIGTFLLEMPCFKKKSLEKGLGRKIAETTIIKSTI
ncbi:hypothetical protein PMAC_002614 [Pneumocystis sp. 'macacae']|nr:hypothetical protein PMAC_002614 [Pneumocystis sp. 'macacae']